jgi:hypothetical protein
VAGEEDDLSFKVGPIRTRCPAISQPKLTTRAKAHEFKTVVIRLAVNENEIRLDVAVAVIVPFAGKRVIDIPARQRRAG